MSRGFANSNDGLASQPDALDVQVIVQHHQVGTFSDVEATEFTIQPEDPSRCQSGHFHARGQIESDLEVHVPDHEIHSSNAARQGTVVGRPADFSVTDDRHAVGGRAENIVTRWHVERPVAIRNQCRAARSQHLDIGLPSKHGGSVVYVVKLQKSIGHLSVRTELHRDFTPTTLKRLPI